MLQCFAAWSTHLLHTSAHEIHQCLDGRTTPWDISIYAFLGDVTKDVATMIASPQNAFQVLNLTWVQSKDDILALLPTLNGLDVLPAVQPNAANAEQITNYDKNVHVPTFKICTIVFGFQWIHHEASLGYSSGRVGTRPKC
jgi:hypothetical protein